MRSGCQLLRMIPGISGIIRVRAAPLLDGCVRLVQSGVTPGRKGVMKSGDVKKLAKLVPE
jgi:hypothetical protein